MHQPTRCLVLCRGLYCNMDRRADKLYRAIKPLIEDFNRDHEPLRIRLQTANCLNHCEHGPNCVIHPGGHVYTGLTPDRLKAIVAEQIAALEKEFPLVHV